MKIIVNADDFGMNESRTMAILACIKSGDVTNTTAMVNMPWFERAMASAKAQSISHLVGLHLNLTEGFPLTSRIRESRLLCDESGCFTNYAHKRLRYRLYLPKFEREVIAEETFAQMERFLSYDNVQLHLDTHHHVHTDFSVASVVLPIAKRFGFKTIRLSRTMCPNVRFDKRIYKFLINRKFTKQFAPVCEEFGSMEDFLLCRNDLAESSCVEIMVHPLFRRDGEEAVSGELFDYKSKFVSIRSEIDSTGGMSALTNYSEFKK